MLDTLSLMMGDINQSFQTFDVEDMVMPLGLLLWLSIILLPLWGMDRRDIHSAVSYALFTSAAGVTMVFAIPQSFDANPSFKTQVIAVTAMALVALARWTVSWEKLLARSRQTQKSFDEEDKEFGRRSAADLAENASRAGKV